MRTLILLLLLCSAGYASPVITDFDGSISGSGFGSGSYEFIYDSFEGGTDGQHLPDSVGSIWTAAGDNGGYYSDDNPRTGLMSAYNRKTATEGNNFDISFAEITPSDKMYASYYTYHTVTGDNYGVMKNSRCMSNYDGELTHTDYYNGPGSSVIQTQFNNTWTYANVNYGTNIGEDEYQKTLTTITTGVWQRVEMYKELGTAGVANGAIRMGINKNDAEYSYSWNENNVITRGEGMTFQMQYFLLGLMYANIRNDGDFKTWIDDVYISNTQARIEIGNSATFASCTHREIQIPTAWSDTEISITSNQGSFLDDTQLYLFVIDEDGTASSGYPVYFSEGTLTGGQLYPISSTITGDTKFQGVRITA